MSEYYNIKLDYQDNLYVLESVLSDIALEADSPTDLNPDAMKSSFTEKIIKKMQILIEKLLQLIDTALLKLKNAWNKIYLTDKGFQSDLSNWRKSYKPLNAIKLIAYEYHDELLDSVSRKLKSKIDQYLQAFNPEDLVDKESILNQDNNTILLDLIKSSGLHNISNIDDGVVFLNEIKKEFRGSKGEHTYTSSSLNMYMQKVSSYKRTQTSLNSEMGRVKNQIVQLRNDARRIARNTNASDEVKRKMNAQLGKLYFIYNFYVAYIRLIFELYIEEMLTARIIIRRLYQQ